MRVAFQCRVAALGVMLGWLLTSSHVVAQEDKFKERREAIKKRFEKSKGRPRNPAVHKPPMVKAKDSDLAESEPVIGVYLSNEARAYPLTMLFGGGGIFEGRAQSLNLRFERGDLVSVDAGRFGGLGGRSVVIRAAGGQQCRDRHESEIPPVHGPTPPQNVVSSIPRSASKVEWRGPATVETWPRRSSR